MRIATPMTLLLISMVRAETDEVIVVGPFSRVDSMEPDSVYGDSYPDNPAIEHAPVVRYDRERKAWMDSGGQPLLLWTVLSVEEAIHRGRMSEQLKAQWVKSEFPPEPNSVFAEER